MSSADGSAAAAASLKAVPPPSLDERGFLTLILDPDLEDIITPGTLIALDNRALFRLLPLVLAAVQRVSENETDRERFYNLIYVLRARIAACRGLKLRFRLLAHNPAFKAFWMVNLVYRRHSYAAAQHFLRQLMVHPDSHNASNESVSLARDLSRSETIHHDSKLVLGWMKDDSMLVSFAARNLLHPQRGVPLRTIIFHMRTVTSAVHGFDLVDGIMERANFKQRTEGVALAQRLLDLNIIIKIASHSGRFRDDRRHVYQCHFALQRDDAGHCHVKTKDGVELTSWAEVQRKSSSAIQQCSIKIPVDMIDLQSHEFWTESVYVRGVAKGYHYGYRAVAHPLYCAGMDPHADIEYNKPSDDQATDAQPSPTESTDSASTGAGSSVDALVKTATFSSDEINDLQQESAVIGSVVVKKVFSSIARPMVIQLRVPMENADLSDDGYHLPMGANLLVKEGDNLMQDLGVETIFKFFNHVWEQTPSLKEKYGMVPFSYSYEVFPTSPTQGFMELVTGLTSLKEFDWKIWKKHYGSDKERVKDMVRSTVGSYVAAYVCGGRDRHFDNVLVKDDRFMIHIDFGFVMGTSPPIDGPPIAISPQMEKTYRDLGVCDMFFDMFVDAYVALRAYAPAIVRTAVMIFTKAGYEEDQIRTFLKGKFSLNVHESEEKSMQFVRKQLVSSSTDIKTKFKQFAHEKIDPAWYGLLEKGFPPAVAIMKIVDAKEQRAAKKLIQKGSKARNSGGDSTLEVDEQKLEFIGGNAEGI